MHRINKNKLGIESVECLFENVRFDNLNLTYW